MTNPLISELYTKLGELLEERDDVFLHKGIELIKEYSSKTGFLEGYEFGDPRETYSRKKIMGGEGKLIMRGMNWTSGFDLLPHEHHDRACIMLLLSGSMNVRDYESKKLEELYELSLLEDCVFTPGEISIVNPKVTQIHAMKALEDTCSLHFYPLDKPTSFGYVKGDDGLYVRKEIKLKDH